MQIFRCILKHTFQVLQKNITYKFNYQQMQTIPSAFSFVMENKVSQGCTRTLPADPRINHAIAMSAWSSHVEIHAMQKQALPTHCCTATNDPMLHGSLGENNPPAMSLRSQDSVSTRSGLKYKYQINKFPSITVPVLHRRGRGLQKRNS